MKKSIVFFSLFALCACDFIQKKEKTNHNTSQNTEILDTIPSDTTKKELNRFSAEETPITIEKISEELFLSEQKKAPKQDSIPRVTNFENAKQLLEGVVEFRNSKNEWEQKMPQKIHFRNGLVLEDNYLFSEIGFVAYFPSEDILLFEGGHTSDFSLHLASGKQTEEVGNPEYIVASPQNKIRLNGSFGGQECSHYFIQQYRNGEWLKIIELDEIFQKITEKWLCSVAEAFWTDENTLYLPLIEAYNENGKHKYSYYKITIKPLENQFDWSDFQHISFPKEEKTNFDNYESFKILDKARAKQLLSGLFPNAEDFRMLYSVPFSTHFTSVVVAFRKGEHELFTVLFNLDKNNQILDYLIIGYDEIAESASLTNSVLQQDFIVIKRENFGNIEISTYQISPEGRFILKKINQKTIQN